MVHALTSKSAEAAKASDKRQEIPDGIVPGLVLIVQASGIKSWALRYRFAGKVCKLTIGRFSPTGEGGLTLSQARSAAGVAIEAAQRGENPASDKKAAKAVRLEGRDKVANLLDQFEQRHLNKLRSRKQVRQLFDKHVLPVWADREVQSIARRDVIELIEDVAEKSGGITANRLLAHIHKFFSWCLSRGVIEINTASGIDKPAAENSRDRVLSDGEIRLFWDACEKEGQPFGSIFKLLLLTGQRKSEIAEMVEAELSGDSLHLDASRTKNGRAHDVPLSKDAQAVLAGVVRVSGKAGYLFTTTGQTPVSGFNSPTNRIRARMNTAAGRELPHWKLHDLRRTCATGLARLAVPVRVTEAVLNHVSGTGGGIVAVYQRHDYAAEKRDALALWAQAIEDILAGLDPVEEMKKRHD
jgi:integrase